MEKMKMESANITDMNIDKIAALFPNCITETADENGKLKKAINFDMLRAMLSEDIAEGDEAYEFTWVGKKAAIAEANRPIRKTLRPCVEESVNWDSTENLYIEGDNLEVLKLLQESYLGKVKMIYIDPPYNTGNDFIYRDDFAVSADDYAEESGQLDEDGNRLFKNTDSNGRFHSDWCSMIYSRLMLARNLLSDDGVIFISIDDNEIDNLKKICDQVFGTSNFVAQFIWKKKQGGGNDSSFVVAEHEYIVSYTKNALLLHLGLDKNYKLDDALYPYSDENGDYGLITLDKASIQFSQSLVYEITGPDGKKYLPRVVKGKQSCWRWSKAKVEKQYDELVFKNDKVYTKYYRPEGVTPRSLLIDAVYGRTESGNDDIKALFQPSPFSYPKPILLIKHFLSIGTDKNDIILDFFSGSATTAHAVMKLNAEDGGHRKFIMVQLPEETDEKSEAFKAGYKNICEIGKERIRRAGTQIKETMQSNDLNKIEKMLHPKVEDNHKNKPTGVIGIAIPIDEKEEERKNNVKKEQYYKNATKLDTGFRVLKLDDTNMQDVYYTPAETTQTMLAGFESNIKPDRTDLDLLFGCLLDWGLPLSMPYSSEQIEGVTVHTYNDGDLIACFDKAIPESVIKTIAKRQPLRVVFRDDSFADSPSKINVSEIFKMLSPDTRVKVI